MEESKTEQIQETGAGTDQEEESINEQFKSRISELNKVENAIYGSVIGAFAGDAAGSYVEFQFSVTKEEAELAVQMVGAGPWSLAPGQTTDDSELAMCILQGLTDAKLRCSSERENPSVVNIDGIAFYFGKWLKGRPGPFDVGMTTQQAFDSIPYTKNEQAFLSSFQFNKVVQSASNNSQSNGCLMRMTTLAAFCHKLKKEDMQKAVVLQTILTHTHLVANKACYLYSYAISILVNEQDPMKAYEETKKEAQLLEQVYPAQYNADNLYKWFEQLEKGSLPDATNQIGYLKIAFVYGFYYLRKYIDSDEAGRNDFYLTTMKDTIGLAGDTDTNACIVGGLIGACVGINGIPKHMVDAILDYDIDQGQLRPFFLVPKYHLIEKLREIIMHAPTELKVQANNKILTDDEILSYMVQPRQEEDDYEIGDIISFKKKD